jgi:hypothetical protein
MLFDDPLMYPNQPGASHLHVFFGNTGTNAASTPASILSTGNSTFQKGIGNRTSAWVPVPIDSRTGRAIAPRDNMVYYKIGNITNASSIVDVPEGLAMIAGHSMSSTVEEPGYVSHYIISCVLNGTGDAALGHIPPCAPGHEIWISLIFPNCWDGVNKDSADHRSHMAYSADGVCPAGHPVPIPTITYNVHYLIEAGDDTSFWRLSSDMYYGADPARAGGITMHGDYIGGWVSAHMHDFMDKCVRARRDCG